MTLFFKFIKTTQNRGDKDRWECPNCREKKMPECKFTLSKKKRGKSHVCRFCKTPGILYYENNN